jgi:tetratricopeptide (TPR) repeat protein
MTSSNSDSRIRSARMLTGGSLERAPFAEVVRTLYRERTTATLLVSRLGEERTFFFDRGQILFASSNREAQLVGELLRTFGLADETLLLSAFEKALNEPGRGLARALTASGAVPVYVAEAAVRALSERLFFDTLRWNSGVFTVTPLDAAPEVPAKMDRPTGGILLEALRRLPAPSSQLNSPLDPGARPVFSSDLLFRYQAIAISPAEAEVLGRVDGVTTVEQIHKDQRIVARLAATGLLQLVAQGRPIEKSGVPEGLLFLNVEIMGAPPPARVAEQSELQRDLIWNTYRRRDWASHSDLLGVRADATPETVAKALHERARLFHPDHHLKPHLEDAREALEALFARVRNAERTFRTIEARTAYDRTLEVSADTIALPGSLPTLEVQREIARKNYTRAKELYEEEDFYPAYEMIRQAVEFDPSQKEYWVLLSRIQRKNPKWVRHATETMRRAVKKIPDNVELWWELAEACASERNEPERVKALKEVMRLDPANRRAQVALSGITAKGSS